MVVCEQARPDPPFQEGAIGGEERLGGRAIECRRIQLLVQDEYEKAIKHGDDVIGVYILAAFPLTARYALSEGVRARPVQPRLGGLNLTAGVGQSGTARAIQGFDEPLCLSDLVCKPHEVRPLCNTDEIEIHFGLEFLDAFKDLFEHGLLDARQSFGVDKVVR